MSLLPPNASVLEKGLEAAVLAVPLPLPLRDIWSPQTCPEALLPWLAWSLSVDDWDAAWPLAVRRQVVAQAIEVHQRKGTLHAVRQAVAAFGGSISIREWWQQEPPGAPGTFSLVLALGEIGGAAPGADYVDAAIRQVTLAKPLSRPFDFTLAISASGAIGVVAAGRPAVTARLDLAA